MATAYRDKRMRNAAGKPAWVLNFKAVDGRRRRESKVGRGHALTGLASEALEEGEVKKAKKLVERATDLAPDSAHIWATKARVEAAQGAAAPAMEAWQRAWELSMTRFM